MKRLSVLLVLVAVALSACGLPDEVKEKAKGLDAKCTTTLAFIADRQKAFEATKKGENGEFITSYAIKEKWQQTFDTAKVRVSDAQQYITKLVKPALKRNEEEEERLLYKYIGKVNVILIDAKKLVIAPRQRKIFLLNVWKNAPAMFKQAKKDVKEMEKLVTSASKKSEKAKVDAKKKKWSKTDKDLDKVFSPLPADLEKSRKALAIMTHEMEKVDRGYSADYATIGDKATEITALLAGLNKKQSAFSKKTDELYRSYSKTLVDKRIEYYVWIGRASWNSDSDWDNSADASIGSKEVSEAVYNYFGSLGTVATYGYGWGRNMDIKVDRKYWDALKIDPLASFPRGDNQAEYWVKGVTTKTLHKYVVTENEKEKETGWVIVSEDFFWANDKNLGMTIVSKPYGFYESEVITDAAPKGMQYIAVPIMVKGVPTGRNQYGSWKKNPSTGGYFWSVVGGVMIGNMASDMLFGGNRYSYNDYYGYSNHTHGSGYYGYGGHYGTYGSNTYRKGSRYGNSNYAKRNAGSVKEARASDTTRKTSAKARKGSIRDAGKYSRGRGASGKGGK